MTIGDSIWLIELETELFMDYIIVLTAVSVDGEICIEKHF